ncbi:phage virion morphogenesis protein [Microbulbifer sp. VAAF005]|uniref:phage virion morphogenesis protein n=1 Tax=Microbulbifer sp. VAAF005 TaxID=3034230 RepID=UPI0024ADE9A0|nr:phage virion morphogenesis protein [Microbulbifer sp. VAAF005]WHI46799.1 phage virion morphogenesis protein [Microbulbifer sp. VAAF005]
MQIDLTGHLKARQQLALLKLPPAKQRRIGGTLARKVRTYSRKRLREQRGLDDKSWEKRKKGPKRQRGKGKMLRGFSKRMRARSTGLGGEVFFADKNTAQIAYQHQHGIAEEWDGQKAEKVYGKPDYKAPATRRQARALKKEGYKVRLPGGRKKKPTLRWITENLTLGQAGLILQVLRDEPKENSWVIELPERSFLGTTDREVSELADMIFKETSGRINSI